jgi:hypothetical protein
MHRIKPYLRYAFGLMLIVLGGFWVFGSPEDRDPRPMMVQAAELKVPENAAVERFDFDQTGPEWSAGAGPARREERLRRDCRARRAIHGR